MEKLRFVEITDPDIDNRRYMCLPNSDQIVNRILNTSNLFSVQRIGVSVSYIFELQNQATNDFDFSNQGRIWNWNYFLNEIQNLFVSSSKFQNLTSRVHLYTQFDNQLDIYNDIVANGINPDSSSWDLRKTFDLMKDPREDAKWISFFLVEFIIYFALTDFHVR